MKKISNFLKKNIKVVVALMIGLTISGIGVYATSSNILFASSVVGFDNTTANLTLDNNDVDNVQDALDALYAKSNSEGCPSGYTMYDQSSSGYSCAKQVTITLNPNGGTVTPTTLSLTSLSTTYGAGGSLPTPTAGGTVAGYNFAGWYTAETGGTKVTDSTTFTYGTSTTTLYAHWSKGGVDDLIAKLGTGGLVAVKSDGTLYSGSGTIREYRYSGPESSVKNYITFNGELWRIIGLFDEDGDGTYNMRIVRNDPLSSAPSTYASTGGGSKTLQYDTQIWGGVTVSRMYWNYGGTSSGKNDWRYSGIKLYLNEEENTNSWYYNNFKKSGASGVNYEKYIDTATWHLGNVTISSSTYYISETAATAYTHERSTTACSSSVSSWSQNSSCYVWNGNVASLDAKIGLLYPSDFGYANQTSKWTTKIMGSSDNTAQSTSSTNWILKSADSSGYYWFISPSSGGSSYALGWFYDGYVGGYSDVSGGYGVRPVLNLTSDTPIVSGTGTSGDPYKIIS